MTVSLGTNRLATVESLDEHVRRALAGSKRPPGAIRLWDGHAAQRVVASLRRRAAASLAN